MDGFRAVGPLEPHGPLTTRGMFDKRPSEDPHHIPPLPAPLHPPSFFLAKRVKHEERPSDWHRRASPHSIVIIGELFFSYADRSIQYTVHA